jgi:iron complex outermembrane receptor protein
MKTSIKAFRLALLTAVTLPLSISFISQSHAQQTDLGAVKVDAAAKPKPHKSQQRKRQPQVRQLPTATPPSSIAVTDDRAIGSGAPAGSAPALALSQGSLNASEPMSIISDKVLRDVIPPGGDYNNAGKLTPGFLSNNVNGPLGDSKSGWRGYQDGQFNITFDGIPFGDANDPTHHSAAYFPPSFLGSVIIDRGPGPASQIGYATFGGTMALNSLQLSDKKGASVEMSYGNFNTFNTTITAQSGGDKDKDTRALISFNHSSTDGALEYGKYSTYQGLIKVEKQIGDVKLTALATGGTETYNNVTSITYAQWQAYGKSYGAVNGNANTQQYVGYNNSIKATDMEYIRLEDDIAGFKVDNKAYTYAYWYPSLQNNGSDQTIEGSTSANTFPVKVPTFSGGIWGSTTYYALLNTGDVVGYVKNNNYRAFGDTLKISHDLNIANTKGELRTGVWVENISNDRKQEYIDYTTGTLFPNINFCSTNTNPCTGTSLTSTAQTSYKLLLNSQINNVQPWIEYEWHPTSYWTITPGYKYEVFMRDHLAAVNQTTLQPADFNATYTASLPFLASNYKLTDHWSIYGQASKGFLAPGVAAYYVYNSAFSQNSISPQNTTNYQIGTVYKTEDYTFGVDAYRITADNFPITTTYSDGSTSYVNGGTARYQGLEAEGTYKVVNNFAVYASGALIGAKFIDGANTGLRVGDAPTYTLAGGLIYDDKTFFGSLIHRINGDYYGSSGQTASTIAINGDLNKVSSWSSTDVVLGLNTEALKRMGFGEKAQVKIGVNNLFNNTNITEISGAPTALTAASSTKLSYQFQAPRTYYISAKVDF